MENVHKELWDNLLNCIKSEVSEQVFNAWFAPIIPVSLSDDTLTLGVPNEFFKEWVRERYSNLLGSYLSEIANKKINIEFSISAVKEVAPQKESEKKPTQKKGWFRSVFPKQAEDVFLKDTGLNPKYTFDSFVVGPSNRFAHAASLAIAESPAKAYNPLFIYGGVGLGKTHLMHAMGNELAKNNTRAKILYISSEEFTNQLISAIQNRATQKFRQKYRTVDMILIDDIHFIAGKEATQEEFFHTFNSLYDAHKQIVLSSDRSPKEIPTLEERLISRFEWGLITDIQPPDFETRIAILRKKCEAETIHLPDDFFFLLAEKVKTNIRELEGALIRVVAYAKLMNKDITIDLAKEVLKEMIIEGEKRVGVDLIQKKVAQYFNINLQDMKIKKRTKAVAYPRQIAMYLSRDLTDLSLPEIGRFFGGRDHTTVLHACEKIENDLKKDEKMGWVIDKLVLSIKSGS
ncbi:MAG: chromosomal replication initiation protein DnaA [Omnitrophica bacterium RBG_13_46_9]|nr:MAG: chromosomal replication initiation protein DnaA [Omnitrophica bacterium RBG_13_46_9]